MKMIKSSYQMDCAKKEGLIEKVGDGKYEQKLWA